MLKPLLQALPGTYVGVLLPASVAAATVVLACHFAGKIPVMLNWTVGERNLLHAVDTASVFKILTSKTVVERLSSRGVALAAIAGRFVYLRMREVGAEDGEAAAHLQWRRTFRRAIRRTIPTETKATAVVLFTSGSESLPKAVPLSHENVLRDLEDAYSVLYIRRDDTLVGMLPPFHSFGLTVCIGGALRRRHAGCVTAARTPTRGCWHSKSFESFGATL